MSISYGGDQITFPDTSTQNTAATGFGFKNRIINGAMVIDQRNVGASVTPTSGAYSLDRWVMWNSQASKYSVQQNAGAVTPPIGFTNYLGITSLSAYSVLTADIFFLNQRIEGFNVSDLGWGTANAKTVTLSFQVYSSLTGTFGGSLINSAQTRSYPFSYTVSAANTWTSITLTVPGDTTGTWLTNNGTGIGLNFGLGVGATSSGTSGSWASAAYYSATGAVSVVGTSGATFYITGVQLEKGSTATAFDYRDYGRELIMCQRYYEVGNSYASQLSTNAMISQPYAVVKRTTPTIVVTSSIAWTGAAAGTISAGTGVFNTVQCIGLNNPSSTAIGCSWTSSAEL